MERRRLSDIAVQEDALLVEQTRLLYAGLPAAIAINTMLGLILASVQMSVIEAPRLLIWSFILGAILIARAALAIAWRRNDQSLENCAPKWMRRFRIAVIQTGIAWGIGAVLLFPFGNITHQVFLAFVLAGLSAGAITSLGVDRVSTRGFLAATLLPLVACFWIEGGTISLAMGVMVVLFLLFISASGARVGESFNEIIQLRIEAVNREKVLKQSEKRLNQAQQIAHLGSSVYNPETSQLQWSDEHFRLWGIEPQSVTPSYELFRNGIHPDDVARVERVIADAMQSGGMYDCEHRIVRPDGSIRHVHSCGEATLDDAGKVIQMTGTVQDITVRKKTETLQ